MSGFREETAKATWASYLIPGLPIPVMRNKLTREGEPYGLVDPIELEAAETALTSTRMVELLNDPLVESFQSLHYMQQIHAYLFQDVYAWAGLPREVNMSKAGHDYAPAGRILDQTWEQHQLLTTEHQWLHGISDPQAFAELLALHWGLVNYTHLFREGNTRTQVLFFEQLVRGAGWELDVARFDPKHPESIRNQFVAARFYHQDNDLDSEPLARLLGFVVTLKDPERVRAQEAEHAGRQNAEAIAAIGQRGLDALKVSLQPGADPLVIQIPAAGPWPEKPNRILDIAQADELRKPTEMKKILVSVAAQTIEQLGLSFSDVLQGDLWLSGPNGLVKVSDPAGPNSVELVEPAAEGSADPGDPDDHKTEDTP